MAKKPKKNKKNDYVKDISEMSDTEFIRNVDYLSSPYYRAYINARVQAELGVNAWSGVDNVRNVEKINVDGKKKTYAEKRVGAVILIAVLLLVATVVGIVGLLGTGSPFNYFAVLSIPGATEEVNRYIFVTDPIIGMFGKANMQDSVYFGDLVGDRLEGASTITKIAFYAVPFASLVLLIFVAFGLLKALVSVFSGKKNGGYHKYKFGFISIVMLLCTVVIVLGGMFAAGLVVDGVVDFFTFKSRYLCAGYGMYVLAAVSIATFILSCISYKKTRRQ